MTTLSYTTKLSSSLVSYNQILANQPGHDRHAKIPATLPSVAHVVGCAVIFIVRYVYPTSNSRITIASITTYGKGWCGHHHSTEFQTFSSSAQHSAGVGILSTLALQAFHVGLPALAI